VRVRLHARVAASVGVDLVTDVTPEAFARFLDVAQPIVDSLVFE